jgi:uncharacterized protein (DUF924 family)
MDFWFGTSTDDAETAVLQAPLWWQKVDASDREITARFADTLRRAAAGELDDWRRHPRGGLALIIVLDQFSRMVHRGTPQAFTQDERALDLCVRGLDAGEDHPLRPIERVFFYLPLMHAESLPMQRRSVERFRQLHDEVPPSWQPVFAPFSHYAERHLAIIAEFGRFPHRNAILGRESTPAEIEFSKQAGSSF